MNIRILIKAVTYEYFYRTGSSGRKPKGNGDHYETKTVSDISLYYSNEMANSIELTIKLESFLGIKKLSVIGLEPKQK